ncbi:patatin-like phospholipase domain-containing protein [Anaeromyxobacter terrae]|uniref:hypothetical protein n=1 Tax=Anaeromyxobacter terrae TaxID=2925406 RepID=UPI001F599164|nr:hypothetical protein [Anaeromyxobacter sp. SG22]
MRGKRLDAALERWFGARDIADTWRPFFCTSANLTRARPEVHRSGPLALARRDLRRFVEEASLAAAADVA